MKLQQNEVSGDQSSVVAPLSDKIFVIVNDGSSSVSFVCTMSWLGCLESTPLDIDQYSHPHWFLVDNTLYFHFNYLHGCFLQRCSSISQKLVNHTKPTAIKKDAPVSGEDTCAGSGGGLISNKSTLIFWWIRFKSLLVVICPMTKYVFSLILSNRYYYCCI